MRNAFVIAAFLAFVAGGATAQTGTSPPPAQNGPQNSAINSSTKDRKSTRLNSSHSQISYAVFCLKQIWHTNQKPSMAGRSNRVVDGLAYADSPPHQHDP